MEVSQFTIENLSDRDITGAQVQWYFTQSYKDMSDGILFHTQDIDTLPANSSRQYQAQFYVPAEVSRGSYFLAAKIIAPDGDVVISNDTSWLTKPTSVIDNLFVHEAETSSLSTVSSSSFAPQASAIPAAQSGGGGGGGGCLLH